MEQSFFNYNLKPKLAIDDFFVSSSNIFAYKHLLNSEQNEKIFLFGPNKSGKTHLGLVWMKKFNALKYDNNIEVLINSHQNIFVDDLFNKLNEEDIFHLINHCKNNGLNILITSNIPITFHKFIIKDLLSRLKTFDHIKIDLPDDELLINLMIKLLHDKQIIVNNPEIFKYILKRIHRSYEKIFLLVEKIDKLSLEKKRELTIPLIKELI